MVELEPNFIGLGLNLTCRMGLSMG